MDITFIPKVLDENISQEKLQKVIDTAKDTLKIRWGKSNLSSSLLEMWSGSSSPETTKKIISCFNDDIKQAHSAGHAALIFSSLALSITGENTNLTVPQRTLLERICLDAIEVRPLPTALWAEFVSSQLDNPSLISHVLAFFAQNSQGVLENKIRNSMRRSYSQLAFGKIHSMMVFGYSWATVEALRGLPSEILGKIQIFTPEQSLPDRDRADGFRLKESLKEVANVNVIKNEEAISILSKGNVDLLAMGCKVIGKLRESINLHIINSRHALSYVEAASGSHTQVCVITDSHKVWPISLYEKYYSKIASDDKNSRIEGDCIQWIMTEHGIVPQTKFGSLYSCFLELEGIPVPTIVEAIGGEDVNIKDIEQMSPKIYETEEEYKVYLALDDKNWDFRTIEGIAQAYSLEGSKVKEAIEKYPRDFRKAYFSGKNDRDLFTLWSKRITFREKLALLHKCISSYSPWVKSSDF